MLERRGDLLAYGPDRTDASRCRVLVTTRLGGASEGAYTSLNLGLRVGDNPGTVVANRRAFFEAYGLPLERSVWCKQVHSDGITIVGESDAGRGALDEDSIVLDTDAMITSVVDLPLCVTLADCVPVSMYDPVNHVVALSHAGWGGTVSRLTKKTVEAMVRNFGTEPATVVAYIGPSIAPEDYEVGKDVSEAARTAFGPKAGDVLRPNPEPGKARFDLWEANRIDLLEAGVPAGSIEISRVSTAQHLDRFYSHRVEAGPGRPTGRIVAVVALGPVD